jgi:hypothetical protein
MLCDVVVGGSVAGIHNLLIILLWSRRLQQENRGVCADNDQ